MKRFMLLFVGRELQPGGDDETRTYMADWRAWMDGLNGRAMLESGSAFEWGGKVVGKDFVQDYVPKDIDFGGYIIVDAADADEAAKIASQAPSVALGGTVIVRPFLDTGT